jgi:Xaa-Pro aminopeptidase
MIHDIDAIMDEKGIDCFMITGTVSTNPSMYYITGGANLTGAICVKKRNEEPVLLHGIMEREEAAKTGFTVRDYNQLGLMEITRSESDPLRAQVRFFSHILSEFDIKGRISFYGNNDIAKMLPLIRRLAETHPEIEVVEDYADNLFERARITKSDDEIAIIRDISNRVGGIIEKVREKLRTAKRDDQGKLHKDDGGHLTVGDMKEFIRVAAIREGLVEDVETIFAIGRDAGIPHSSGKSADVIECGKSIVFDFFPRQIGGGYFFDVTRTFCIGAIPKELEQLYRDVREVQEAIFGEIRPDTAASRYQEMTCRMFEDRGYPTILDNPSSTDGYVHGLGHGLGLDIHEKPFFSMSKSNRDRLQRGSVFTIEPGLYFPDRGMGVRIEDVVCINGEGEVENLSPFSKELLVA